MPLDNMIWIPFDPDEVRIALDPKEMARYGTFDELMRYALNGPLPLHDLATMLLAAGLNPLADRALLAPRWDVEWTGTRHNPIDDARLAARLFRLGLQLIGPGQRC